MKGSEWLESVIRQLPDCTDAELCELKARIIAEQTRHWLGNPPQDKKGEGR